MTSKPYGTTELTVTDHHVYFSQRTVEYHGLDMEKALCQASGDSLKITFRADTSPSTIEGVTFRIPLERWRAERPYFRATADNRVHIRHWREDIKTTEVEEDRRETTATVVRTPLCPEGLDS